jgi:hypothetical protein
MYFKAIAPERQVSLEWLKAASFPQLASSSTVVCFSGPAGNKAFRTDPWLISSQILAGRGL